MDTVEAIRRCVGTGKDGTGLSAAPAPSGEAVAFAASMTAGFKLEVVGGAPADLVTAERRDGDDEPPEAH